MKLEISKKQIYQLTREVLAEYILKEEENPFEDSDKKEEPAADAEGEEKADDKSAEASVDALKVKFEPSQVKKYNTNTDWKSGEGVVKGISKKGLEVEVDGSMVIINFDDLVESAKSYYSKKKLNEQEDEKIVSDLDQAMGSSLKALASAFETDIEAVKADVDKMPEKQLNEALGTVAILGMVLAAPKVVELITKGLSKLVKLFKKLIPKGQAKTDDEKKDVAAKIIDFTHKWHKMYIKGLKGLLKISGIFKKAGITEPAAQDKAAKLLYYSIVAGLAVYSGIGAISAFKDAMSVAAHAGSFEIGTLEAVMAAIKSGEVAEFIGELGLEAASEA